MGQQLECAAGWMYALTWRSSRVLGTPVDDIDVSASAMLWTLMEPLDESASVMIAESLIDDGSKENKRLQWGGGPPCKAAIALVTGSAARQER